jgi:flagellar transcriptional activator FlhD
MNTEQILTEVREANLSFLMLAQKLIRNDLDSALSSLGVSRETAALVEVLSPAQIVKLASGNTLLCRISMTDDLVLGLLTSHGRRAQNDATAHLHAKYLMAERETLAA